MHNTGPAPAAAFSRISEPQRASPLRAIGDSFLNWQALSLTGYPTADALHIPGDTTTPPAPDAVWIGTGDA